MKIRGESNQEYNSMLDVKKEKLKLVNKTESVNKKVKLLPCSYCNHYYVDYSLSRHMRACPVQPYVSASAVIEKGDRSFRKAGRHTQMASVKDTSAWGIVEHEPRFRHRCNTGGSYSDEISQVSVQALLRLVLHTDLKAEDTWTGGLYVALPKAECFLVEHSY